MNRALFVDAGLDNGQCKESCGIIELKLAILRGRQGLEAAEDAWRELAESTAATSPSQLVEYYLAYARAFDVPDDELLIAMVEDSSGQVIAVLPLARTKKRVLGIEVRTLKFPEVPVPIRDIVAGSSCPPSEILAFILRSIDQGLIGRWDYLHFRDVPEKSSLVVAQQPGHGWSQLAQEVGSSHFLDVSKGDYIRNVLNSNARNNLRRSRKKIEKLGEIYFRTVTAFPELEEAYDQFLATEAAGWKSVRGGQRAIKLHADQTRFYFDLMTRLAETGRCHIHLLYLDEHPVASDYCVVSGDRVFSVKHGYDETYSRFAPGNLLRAYTIEYYEKSRSINCLDLVSGWDWQRRWRPKRNSLFDIKIFSQSLRGTMLYHLATLSQLNKSNNGRG